MHPIKRTVVIGSIGLGFLAIGGGGAGAVVFTLASSTAPTSQCNGDPGFDPSRDPVNCQYANPLPAPDSIGAPEKIVPAPAPAPPKKK